MFSPQFYSHNANHNPQHNHTNDQHFDWKMNCGHHQYAIKELKDQYKRVVAVKLFRLEGHHFEFVQEFCANQFHGAFFANIRVEDYHCNGTVDLVADVYNAHCYLCGTVILTNTHKEPCGHKLPHPRHHCPPPAHHPCHDPCAPPPMSFPCPPPVNPCPPPHHHTPCHNPCLAHTVSRSDVTNCRLLSVDVKDAHVTSVNEIFVKPLAPITSTEKLCDIIQCCKKTTECLEEFDPHFASKLTNKGHTTYSGPVKAETGWININDCSITFDGLNVPCPEHRLHQNSGNCIKF
jgi:hypothetical protein